MEVKCEECNNLKRSTVLHFVAIYCDKKDISVKKENFLLFIFMKNTWANGYFVITQQIDLKLDTWNSACVLLCNSLDILKWFLVLRLWVVSILHAVDNGQNDFTVENQNNQTVVEWISSIYNNSGTFHWKSRERSAHF